MRRDLTNTSLDGKFINVQIRIVCLANREKKRKPMLHYDPAAIRDYIKSGEEYTEHTVTT